MPNYSKPVRRRELLFTAIIYKNHLPGMLNKRPQEERRGENLWSVHVVQIPANLGADNRAHLYLLAIFYDSLQFENLHFVFKSRQSLVLFQDNRFNNDRYSTSLGNAVCSK